MIETGSDFAEDYLVYHFTLSYSDIAITFFNQSQTLYRLDLFPSIPHIELQLRFSHRIQHRSRRRRPRTSRALALSLKEDSDPRVAEREREREKGAFTLSLPRRQLTVCVETFVLVTLVRQREAKRDAMAEWVEGGQKVSVKRGGVVTTGSVFPLSSSACSLTREKEKDKGRKSEVE
jgi:hypothetical protein